MFLCVVLIDSDAQDKFSEIGRPLIIITSNKVFADLEFLDLSRSGQRKGIDTSPDGGCFLRRQVFATVGTEASDIQW